MLPTTFLKIPKLGMVAEYPDNRLCLMSGDEVLDVSTPIYARTPDCFFVKLYELTANWMDRQRDYRVTFFCDKKIQLGIQKFTDSDNTKLPKIVAGNAVPADAAFLSFKLRSLQLDVMQIGFYKGNLYALGRERIMQMPMTTPEDLYFFTYASLDLNGLTISNGGVNPLLGQPMKSASSYFAHNPEIAVSGLSQLQQVLPTLVSKLTD